MNPAIFLGTHIALQKLHNSTMSIMRNNSHNLSSRPIIEPIQQKERKHQDLTSLPEDMMITPSNSSGKYINFKSCKRTLDISENMKTASKLLGE